MVLILRYHTVAPRRIQEEAEAMRARTGVYLHSTGILLSLLVPLSHSSAEEPLVMLQD